MLGHSKTLEMTALWKAYLEKITKDSERSKWIEDVYKNAVEYLKDVRQVFKNYTLHDETHVLNVLDAMGGLLGNQIGNLTVGEMELLILAASLHDLGMVYTNEEIDECLRRKAACKAFLRENYPDLFGNALKDCSENIRQCYLRELHPFRISDVLRNDKWEELFNRCPIEIVSRQYILAVCQAHGEKPEQIRNNQKLEYLSASDVDPRFCALLLRLADLLDFDDTRAPKVLYSYAECNDKSRKEWDKHQASAGFRYHHSPSVEDLPYKARCKNPAIEHAVRDFLDWIDEELGNAALLKKYCKAGWRQEFPFPRAVLRKELESDGYMSGDFCLTMDQEKILNLLMGENLYYNRGVFVRELLQNAIDAVLLRSEMDRSFIAEESRIDFWEWTDKEGNLWFRIDDEGTGMTLGMLKRYFLKVGNSYYISKELEKDLRDYEQVQNYQGISRFGIGFLSCFLCGDYVEVSTLYWNPDKNRQEKLAADTSLMTSYGLRLQLTGLKGYFTLKNQAENHEVNELPIPPFCDTKVQSMVEIGGYRVNSGTSIIIRLNPGRLGTLNLRETAEKYLCGAKIPVYYNKKRVGRTYTEAMKTAHDVAGERLYELPPGLKKEFDNCFPHVCNNYPKLVATVIPLDTEENQVLSGFSGVLVKYELKFDSIPKWEIKGQSYIVHAYVNCELGRTEIQLSGKNVTETEILMSKKPIEWSDLEREYGIIETRNLGQKLESFMTCPEKEQLGKIWEPFSEKTNVSAVWQAYYDYCNEKKMSFEVMKCQCPDICTMFCNNWLTQITYAYKGVIAGGDDRGFNFENDNYSVIFLLDGKWKPNVEISRSKILSLPLEVLLAINVIASKYGVLDDMRNINELKNSESITLQKYRKIRNSSLGKWINQKQGDYFKEVKQALQEKWRIKGNDEHIMDSLFGYGVYSIIDEYLRAFLQDSYVMEINYEKGQIIIFYKKETGELKEAYDIFPPMMFCKASTEESRKYICHAEAVYRRGITADHPFVVWLLENTIQLNHYFQRQLECIIHYLCSGDAEDILEEWEKLREQLFSLSNHCGIDTSSLPKLSINDFWSEKV